VRLFMNQSKSVSVLLSTADITSALGWTVRVCVCVCVRACVRACMFVTVCMCVWLTI